MQQEDKVTYRPPKSLIEIFRSRLWKKRQIKHDNPQMRGPVDVTKIDCEDYKTGEQLDSDVEYYIKQGMVSTVKSYKSVGWIWFFPWAFADDIKVY